MGQLNEELYMLKLQAMTPKELDSEEYECCMAYNAHRQKLEDNIARLAYQRFRCIQKFRQMLELLNV